MAQAGFDRRRINGPEESFPPVFDDDDVLQSSSKPRQGRKPSEIRPICTILMFSLWQKSHYALVLQPGLITQANGSAYIETDKTKIACAV